MLNCAGCGDSMRPMSDEITIPAILVPQSCSRAVDREIAALAERQHGVVALAQLMALGLGARAVRARVAAGRLHRIHRGVYAVGHALVTAKGRWMAGVLACGAGAALSHRSAAALLDVRPSTSILIEVVVPRRRSSAPRGIVARYRSALAPADVTVVDAIPCTSVACTLLDLAAVEPDRIVEKACDRAEQLQIFDLRALEDILARNPRA
jgi:predicted transcriptional regulator of viral defense system